MLATIVELSAAVAALAVAFALCYWCYCCRRRASRKAVDDDKTELMTVFGNEEEDQEVFDDLHSSEEHMIFEDHGIRAKRGQPPEVVPIFLE